MLNEKLKLVGDANENRGGGDHELFFECGGYVDAVDWGLDNGAERVDDTVELVRVVVVRREEGIGELVEEDEELELDGEREVLAEKRVEEEIEERREGAPFAAAFSAELEIFD